MRLIEKKSSWMLRWDCNQVNNELIDRFFGAASDWQVTHETARLDGVSLVYGSYDRVVYRFNPKSRTGSEGPVWFSVSINKAWAAKQNVDLAMILPKMRLSYFFSFYLDQFMRDFIRSTDKEGGKL